MSVQTKLPTISDAWKMSHVLAAVEGLPGFVLRVTFDDGEVYDIPFSKIVGTGGLTDELSNIEYFKQVRLGEDGHCIEWPNGYDNCWDTLRWDGELARRGLTRADVPEAE
jgi:hypothetical protein